MRKCFPYSLTIFPSCTSMGDHSLCSACYWGVFSSFSSDEHFCSTCTFFAVTLPTPGKYNCFPCFLLREYKSGGNCWRWCCCLTPALHHSKWEQMELSKALTPGAEHSVLASTNSPRSGSGSSWWCHLLRLLSCAFCTQQRHKSYGSNSPCSEVWASLLPKFVLYLHVGIGSFFFNPWDKHVHHPSSP